VDLWAVVARHLAHDSIEPRAGKLSRVSRRRQGRGVARVGLREVDVRVASGCVGGGGTTLGVRLDRLLESSKSVKISYAPLYRAPPQALRHHRTQIHPALLHPPLAPNSRKLLCPKRLLGKCRRFLRAVRWGREAARVGVRGQSVRRILCSVVA
jgi:hypothetical protein